jgi:hypothetical protein
LVAIEVLNVAADSDQDLGCGYVMRKAATLAVADVTAQRKTRKARLRERAGPVEAFGTLTARLKTAAR